MKMSDIRQLVIDAYPMRGWRRKVELMEDEQVIAIYKSMREQDRLNRNSKKKDDNKPRYIYNVYNHNGPFNIKVKTTETN